MVTAVGVWWQRHRASGTILQPETGLVNEMCGDRPVNDAQHFAHRLRVAELLVQGLAAGIENRLMHRLRQSRVRKNCVGQV